MRIVLCSPIRVFSVSLHTNIDSELLTMSERQKTHHYLLLMEIIKNRPTLWGSNALQLSKGIRYTFSQQELMENNSTPILLLEVMFFLVYLWQSVLYLRRT